MTEAEWRVCNDPLVMLAHLRSKASNRKGRLFGCACCYRIWHLLGEESRAAVKLAEEYADELIDPEELDSARVAAMNAAGFGPWEWVARLGSVADQVASLAFDVVTEAALDAWEESLAEQQMTEEEARLSAPYESYYPPPVEAALAEYGTYMCAVIRDIFGNPFRPVTIDPAILRWNDGCVVKITEAIYAERRFTDLPILADALEDAGCANADLLKHCREPGQHVRGCWVVDLLLGKS
jgi:hypothetical protein